MFVRSKKKNLDKDPLLNLSDSVERLSLIVRILTIAPECHADFRQSLATDIKSKLRFSVMSALNPMPEEKLIDAQGRPYFL